MSCVTLQAPAIHMGNHRSRLFSCQEKAAWNFSEKSSWKTYTHFLMLAWEMAHVTSTDSPWATLALPFTRLSSYCCLESKNLGLSSFIEKLSIVTSLNCFPVFPWLPPAGNLISCKLVTPYLLISFFCVLCHYFCASLRMIFSLLSSSPHFPLI